MVEGGRDQDVSPTAYTKDWRAGAAARKHVALPLARASLNHDIVEAPHASPPEVTPHAGRCVYTTCATGRGLCYGWMEYNFPRAV